MSPCNEHASTWHPPLLAVGEPKIFQAPKIFQVLRKYLNWNYLHDTYTEHVRHRSTQLVQLLILCNRSRDVLRIVTGRVWALTSAQYPGLCCDKVQCHRRHPAISRDHLLISDRASISNTLIVTARPARSLVMRMMSGSIVHQDYHRDSLSGWPGLRFPDWCHCPVAALHYCQEHCLKCPLIRWLSTERSK